MATLTDHEITVRPDSLWRVVFDAEEADHPYLHDLSAHLQQFNELVHVVAFLDLIESNDKYQGPAPGVPSPTASVPKIVGVRVHELHKRSPLEMVISFGTMIGGSASAGFVLLRLFSAVQKARVTFARSQMQVAAYGVLTAAIERSRGSASIQEVADLQKKLGVDLDASAAALDRIASLEALPPG